MSFVDKIIAKIAGFDPHESEQASLIRTQPGHQAMPDLKTVLQDERADMRRDMNREREQEDQRHHVEFRPGEEVHPMSPEVSADKKEEGSA